VGEGAEAHRLFLLSNLERVFLVGELKVVTVVFAGFFENSECWMWCFCGQVVVECVANVVSGRSFFGVEKMRHVFQLFFLFDTRLQGEGEKAKPKWFSPLALL
jgi:hypothetical protein